MPRNGIEPNKCLLVDVPHDVITRMIVIRRESDCHGNAYTYFNSHVDFYEYMSKMANTSRHFHEIPLANQPQKPRFDIDIEATTEAEAAIQVKDALRRVISAVIQVCKRDSIPINPRRDFVVFSSHGREKSGFKCSYHVIMPHHMHGSCYEAQAFFDQVVGLDRIPGLDVGIYKRNHGLRTYTSCKPGSHRVKSYCPRIPVGDSVVEHELYMQPLNSRHREIIILAESLLTVALDCYYIPSYYKEEIRERSHGEIPEETLQKIRELCEGDYEIIQSDGILVSLKRLRATHCTVCDRVHEKMNPFILVLGTEIQLHCGRAEMYAKKGQHVILGTCDAVVYMSEPEEKIQGLVDSYLSDLAGIDTKPIVTQVHQPPTPVREEPASALEMRLSQAKNPSAELPHVNVNNEARRLRDSRIRQNKKKWAFT